MEVCKLSSDKLLWLVLHTSPFPSPPMTTRTIPGGAFENQWSFMWSEWNMDNDHIEKQETVASWLTPPACKTGKTKTTTDYFYHQIKPKRSYPLSLQGATLTSPPGTHTGLFSTTQLDSQLCRDIKQNKGSRYLQTLNILSGMQT